LSETHFDRSDWRPGARRKTTPRIHCYAGQKVAPLQLLTAGRLAGLHTNTAKRCKALANSTGRVCKRVAVTGADVCMVHGGALALKRNRPYAATGHGQRIMTERALGGDRPDRRKTKKPYPSAT
jgi:hypothetical protein